MNFALPLLICEHIWFQDVYSSFSCFYNIVMITKINQCRCIVYYTYSVYTFNLISFLFRRTSNYQSPDLIQKDMSALASDKVANQYVLSFILN